MDDASPPLKPVEKQVSFTMSTKRFNMIANRRS